MKIAVIDVGSNSIRLLIAQNGKKILKISEVTYLSENLEKTNYLTNIRMENSAKTIWYYFQTAKDAGAEKIYIFGTEACRKAHNIDIFKSRIKELTSLELQVLSGEEECEIGLLGALKNNDGALIDIGGASTEVIVKEGEIKFKKSLPVGIVRLKEACGQDRKLLDDYISSKLAMLGEVYKSEKYFAIGGTATQVVALLKKLEVYDSNVVHGSTIEIEQLEELSKQLFALSIDEIKALKGMSEKRASTIVGGAFLLLKLMQYLNLTSLTVSEEDNLEGFLNKITP